MAAAQAPGAGGTHPQATPGPGGQSAAPAATQQPASTPKADASGEVGKTAAASVPADAVVITLTNFCETTGVKVVKPSCKKVITRAQFEQVVNAAIPPSRRPPGGEIPPQVKQAIAKEYASLLVMANEAQKRGLPARDPNTQEMLRLARLQVLAQALNTELQEKTKPTAAEIEKYYLDNTAAFEEATLRRLFIPKAATENPKPADASAAQAQAEKLRQRAAAGEDFDKLQQEAFTGSGNKQTPPTTLIGARRRGTLPADQEEQVFGLKPGAVSPLFENPGGWYVYKVESKRAVSLEDAKEEITRRLQPQKFGEARTAITSAVKTDLNDKYFGPPVEPARGEMAPGASPKTKPGTKPPGPSAMHEKPAAPPASTEKPEPPH